MEKGKSDVRVYNTKAEFVRVIDDMYFRYLYRICRWDSILKEIESVAATIDNPCSDIDRKYHSLDRYIELLELILGCIKDDNSARIGSRDKLKQSIGDEVYRLVMAEFNFSKTDLERLIKLSMRQGRPKQSR